MKFNATVLVLFITVIFASQAQEIKAPIFGKGIVNIVGKDSSFTMKIGARIQILGTYAWELDDGEFINPFSNMLIRRARIKFDGFAYSPKLVYKIELGLSNRDMSGTSIYTRNSPRIIMDAVMKWNFHGNFVFWFGQTKLPGNRERVISSADLQFVDRSILNAEFNIDRDIGVQLRHHIKFSDAFVMREILAISQGEGRNVTQGNQGGFQYTGRLEFLPFGTFPGKEDYKGSDLMRIQTPKLSVGVSYDFNNNAVRTRSNMGPYMITDDGLYETNITTVFVDAMFKLKGISFMGEYAYRDAANPIVTNLDGTPTGQTVQVGNGINLQGGYLFKNNWELSGRYSNVNFNQDITGEGLVQEHTLCVSKYIVGQNLKVQSDLTYIDNEFGNAGLAYRLQFEMQF
jgi:hypothetical protein